MKKEELAEQISTFTTILGVVLIFRFCIDRIWDFGLWINLKKLYHILNFFSYLLVFQVIMKKIPKKEKQCLCAVTTGITYALYTMLFNNIVYFGYIANIKIEEEVGWKDFVTSIVEDITGDFRYLIRLVGMSLMCLFFVFGWDRFLIKKFRKLKGKIMKRTMERGAYFLCEMESERLVLRGAIEADIERFDDMVCTISNERETVEKYVRKWMREYDQEMSKELVVARKEDNQAIGVVSITNYTSHNEKVELAFFIGEEYRRHGYMKEALREVIHNCFGENNIHKLVVRVRNDNEDTKKFLENNGFIQEGTFKDELYLDGIYIDVDCFALINK